MTGSFCPRVFVRKAFQLMSGPKIYAVSIIKAGWETRLGRNGSWRHEPGHKNPLRIELRTHAVFLQKLNYIHWNPVRAGLCSLPEEYDYSSARFYETGIDNWGFLTHYRD